MQCTRCGYENPDTTTVCVGCGHQLDPPMMAPLVAQVRDEARAGQPAAAPPAAQDPPDHRQGERHQVTDVLQPLSVGEVIGQVFTVYFSNFMPFFLISLMANAPVFLFSFYLWGSDPSKAFTGNMVWAFLGVSLASLLATSLATAAMTFGVLQHLRRRSVMVGECLRTGLSVLAPVIGVALAQSILIGLGTLLCLIPGIIAAVAYLVAVPVAVEERPGVSKSLERSSALTSGYRWPVFGVLFLIVVIHVVASTAINILGARGLQTVGFVLGLIEGVLYSGLTATMAALIYYRLRCLKEALNIEELASVFD